MADILKIIGFIMIVIGAVILFTAIPIIQQSMLQIGLVKATDIPQPSATRIIVGVIGIILGLVVYFGKEGLKIFMRR